MKEELEKRLIDRFPLFYRPNNYGANQERFGFECMNGYFDLIWKTSENIESVFKKYPIIYFESFSIIQLKSKFRELRVYWSFDSDTLDKDVLVMIRSELFQITGDAEKESRTLCEVCGKKVTDAVINTTWYVKCLECAKKEQDEKQSSEI